MFTRTSVVSRKAVVENGLHDPRGPTRHHVLRRPDSLRTNVFDGNDGVAGLVPRLQTHGLPDIKGGIVPTFSYFGHLPAEGTSYVDCQPARTA